MSSARSLISCAVFGLLGPAMAFASHVARHYGGADAFPEVVQLFLFAITLLLWPTQWLSLWETAIGTAPAVLLAVFANVLLMLILGWIFYRLASTQLASRAAQLVLAVCLVAMSFFLAGYEFAHVQWPALGVALLLYMLVFRPVFRPIDASVS